MAGRNTACRSSATSSPRSRNTPRTSSSTSPTSPCSGPSTLRARQSRARLRLAVRRCGLRLRPAGVGPFELPSIAVVGTGKRVGKTAVTGHLARLLAARAAGRRRRDGEGWAGGARARRVASHRRCARRAVALGSSCGVRPSRDRGARGRRDCRVPAVAEAAAPVASRTPTSKLAHASRRLGARRRRLRRQRRSVSADRDRAESWSSSAVTRIRRSPPVT